MRRNWKHLKPLPEPVSKENRAVLDSDKNPVLMSIIKEGELTLHVVEEKLNHQTD